MHLESVGRPASKLNSRAQHQSLSCNEVALPAGLASPLNSETMKTKKILIAMLLPCLAAQCLRASETDGKRYVPTTQDLAVALGMMWWTITPPEGAEGIEFGFISGDDFELIARDEFDSRSASSPVKIVYRDRGAKFDLTALSDGGTLFMPAQEKPNLFHKVLNPARKTGDADGFEFVRFQSKDKKSWDKVLVGRFFGAAFEGKR